LRSQKKNISEGKGGGDKRPNAALWAGKKRWRFSLGQGERKISGFDQGREGGGKYIGCFAKWPLSTMENGRSGEKGGINARGVFQERRKKPERTGLPGGVFPDWRGEEKIGHALVRLRE